MGVHSFPKTFTSFFIVLTLACQQAFGQVTIVENFTDGNFSDTPTWSGTSAHYVVTGANELQLNNTVAATSYLSTPFAISNIGESSWEFTLHHNFAGSGSNYSRVYLMSTNSDLTGSLNGYYLQFGEALSNDAIELFKQTGTTSVSVARGPEASIAGLFSVRVRVTRDNAGTWKLFADYAGGLNLAPQDSAVDNTFNASSFFGIRSTYTIANSNDVFLDNILVSAYQAPDTTPPVVNNASVISSTTIDVHFSEALDTASVENINNYVIKRGHQNPLSSSFQTDQQTVRLTFSGSFINGVIDTLIVKNIQDTTLNSLDSIGVVFLFFQPVEATSKDIIINELFPDPLPSVGLPEAEFVELYNRSSHPFNLKGWKITDGTSTGILDSLILLPNEYCIITSNASFALYSLLGKTVHISSLSSLNNASDHIRLRNPSNKTIDSVSYTSLWYQDDEKDLGGWTLELIDPQNFCRGAENWRASVNILGGTPGHMNSVFEIIPDDEGPRLTALIPLTEKLVRLDFNESMSFEAPPANGFDFFPSLEIDSVYFDPLTSSSLFLTLNDELDSAIQYTVQLNNIFDCPGNLIQPLFSSITFKLDSIPPVMDSVTVLSNNSIALHFSEPVNELSAENVLNYQLDESSPASAVLENENVVVLTFGTSFTNGHTHRISFEEVSDFAGNESLSAETDFLYFVPSPSSAFDVVITEIFPDPAPALGLPEAEFIEIFNRSNSPFQLEGWTISDATSTTALPAQILLPNNYLILCSTSNANIYDSIGQSLGVVSFPSLNNTGEPLVLRDANGLIIDSIRYQTSWYYDDEKKDGGWTLERIDPSNVCSGAENWKASTNTDGGTPGHQNSVNAILLDSVGPKFISVEVEGKVAILHFNESLNTILPDLATVAFLPVITIDSLFFSGLDRTSLSVELNSFPDSLTSYTIQLNNIFDCPGNPIQPNFSSRIFKRDTIPPMVNAVDVFSQTEVDVQFSEPVQMVDAISVANYITEGPVLITSIQQLSNLSFRLVFSTPLPSGGQCSIEISNIKDLSGNVIPASTYDFIFFEKLKAEPKDVIISEIFADPTPTIGLPEFEFLELHNRSASAFNLKGWTLSDGTTTAMLDSLILPSGQFVILCSNTAKNSFDSLSKTLGVSGFPTLANSGETLRLKDEDGLTIDSITYNLSSYHDQEKKDGGWSIELIDPDDFCSADLNLKASVDVRGGTPGTTNSVYEPHVDVEGPRLLRVIPIGEDSLIFNFNERLENLLPLLENIHISNGLLVTHIALNDTDPTQYLVRTQSALDSTLTYTVMLDSIHDCPGNVIQNLYSSITFRLDSIPPLIDSVKVTSPSSLRIYFSESIQSQILTDLNNYILRDSIQALTVIGLNSKSVELTFAQNFLNGALSHIKINQLNDYANNASDSLSVEFLFYEYVPVEAKDIIITEVFADPTPTQGLPEVEYLEIYNRSGKAVLLNNWMLLDASTSANLPSEFILPNEYSIVCAASNKLMFQSLGKTIGLTNFPSLNNSGEAIVLKNDLGETIDSIFYTLSWHHSSEAKDGGYALEIIDVEDFCRGSENWTTSLDSVGGTPGRVNSVNADYQDVAGPHLLSLEILSNDTLQLVFDERLNVTTPREGQVSIEPTESDLNIEFAGVLTRLNLISSSILDSALVYTISLDSIFDCYGNELDPSFSELAFKLDSISPHIDSVVVLSSTTVSIFFSEKILTSHGQNLNNYLLTNAIHPSGVEILPGNRVVILSFAEEFKNGETSSLDIIGISDPAGNQMQQFNTWVYHYQYVPVETKDIIISEVFADPSPVAGLPETEFLEIYNRSEKAIQLKDWRLTDATSTTIFPSRIILPGEYLIVCAATKVSTWEVYGKTMGVTSFPSLNNLGEKLVLENEFGLTVDSIQYSTAWYHNNEAKDGGYSLEIIDVNDFCRTAENWSTSIDNLGGTPGKINSINAVINDSEGPRFLYVNIVSLDTLNLIFNEALATSLPGISEINIDPSTSVNAIHFVDASKTTLQVVLESSLDSMLRYQVTIDTLYDCKGNLIDPAFITSSFKIDTIAPTIKYMNVLSSTEILLSVSERIQSATTQNYLNFTLEGFRHPTMVTLGGETEILLTFNEPFENGVTYTMLIKNLSDFAENAMTPYDTSVLYFVPSAILSKDVIITELLADPSPVVFLPEAEYIEILNRSTTPINLEGWTISDETSSAALPIRILKPSEYLIICQSSKVGDFLKYGSVLGVSSLPSLNNSGETVYLKTKDGITIDSMSYSLSSYNDESRNDGGYSLELIDVNSFCLGNLNWTSSMSESGGTPGAVNSVARFEIDVEGPKLLSASAASHLQINLQFDEALSSTVPSQHNFVIEPAIELSLIEFKSGSLHEVELLLLNPLDSSVTYTISVYDVTDCPGNIIQEAYNSVVLKIDEISPSILSLIVVSENELKIEFSERIDSTEIRRNANYRLTPTFSSPFQVTTQDDRTVNLLFANPFENAYQYELEVTGIVDRSLNVMEAVSLPFMFFEEAEVNYRDIIISEIFPDPSPVVSLPEVEFVELYNRSTQAVNLANWTLSDGSQISILGSKILLPQHYLVLCLPSQAFKLIPFGDVLGVSNFPSLNNADDLLILKNAGSVTIDSVRYSDTWYQDDEKKDGGWTLERIDPDNVCAESSNWLASESQQGGTPGKVNSVFEEKPDLTGPTLLTVVAVDPTTIKLEFNEKLNSSLAAFQLVEIVPSVEVESINFTDGSLTRIEIKTVTELKIGTTYSINLFEISDCAGNIIQSEYSSGQFALPEEALPADLIINEILFNPTSTGVDFVELYNNSQKFINLSGFGFANLNNEDKTGWRIITQSDFLVAPNTFVVFTSDPDLLAAEYVRGKRETFQLASLPSLPDDEGSILLIDKNGVVIDSLFYSKQMHSPFIKDEEGVSLERIGTSAGIDVTANWKSASSASGFATPGYVNSNNFENVVFSEAVAVEPEIFSPQLGQPDFAKINYQFDQGGYVANVRVIDASGHEIKILAKNELLGADGFLRWDGDSENGSKARIGAYTVLFEIFDVQGNVKTIRKRVVIAGKF